MEKPHIDIFDRLVAWLDDLLHSWQHLLCCLQSQPEFRELRGLLVSLSLDRKGVGVALGALEPLLLETERLLDHGSGLALALVDLLDREGVRTIDGAKLVLLGACDVAEGVVNL